MAAVCADTLSGEGREHKSVSIVCFKEVAHGDCKDFGFVGKNNRC